MSPFHQLVQFALAAVAVYLSLGAAFALLFHLRGAAHLDHGATGAGWFFRVLITPGVIALWPLLAVKWRRAALGEEFAGPSERPVTARGLRRLHGIFIQILLVLLPIAVAAALFSRPIESVPRTPLPPAVNWSTAVITK